MKKLVLLLMLISPYIFLTQSFASEPTVATRYSYDAYIDYTPIESYIINGYTYIEAENLVNYGFDVSYDDSTKSINISRKRFAYPVYTKAMWERASQKKGPANIIDSDVKVYLDGELVKSYCIGEYNLIMIDELVKYGTFEWEKYEGTVSITMFKDELQQELDKAENVVEFEISNESYYNYRYRGQVDEDNVPDGIGMLEMPDSGLENVKYLGYFEKGKPNGLIYKESHYVPSRCYTIRDYCFIGRIDGSRTAERFYFDTTGEIDYKYAREPNMGVAVLPNDIIKQVEAIENKDVYTEGCYYEKVYGKLGERVYNAWYRDDTYLTVMFEQSRSAYGRGVIDRLRSKNDNIKCGVEFYEYEKAKKLFYDGSLRTYSGEGTADNPFILNDPSVGAGFFPITIPIIVNGAEVKIYEPPVMENGVVLVPIEDIAKKLGYSSSWEKGEQECFIIKNGEDKTRFCIGSNIMYKNDKEIELEVAAEKWDMEIYVPVKAMAEALGVKVEWDDEFKELLITTHDRITTNHFLW